MGKEEKTSKPLAVYVTREELLAKRELILSKLGYSLEEWNRKYLADDMEGEDWVYRDELSGISFLLNE